MFRKRYAFIRIFISLLMVVAIFQGAIDYKNEREAAEKETHAVKTAEYCVFIDIGDKTLYLLQDDKCIKQYPIASGKSGKPSPLGFWKIVSKSDWGEGFGGRWMELNVPWGT